MTRTTLLATAAAAIGLAVAAHPAGAKPVTGVGITLGSLGNPYFVALDQGATAATKGIA